MKVLLIGCILCLLLAGCSAATSSDLLTPFPTTDTVSPTPLPTLTPIIPTPQNSSRTTSIATATAVPSGVTNTQMGYLEGHVNIGPLSPVQRIDQPTPVVPPEVYAARSINIFRSDGTTLVTNVKINSVGNYRVELAPGTYVVAIARSGVDRAAGLPTSITIESGQTLQLDISIDTGMR